METRAEDIKASKPDCLVPGDTSCKAVGVCTGKADMPLGRSFILSILAGMYIGCGGLFMLFVKADTTLSFAASQVLGGLCFALGLMLVIVAGAELFTGNCLLVMGKAEGVVSWGKMFRNWALVWVGNFIGSLVLVCLVYFANTAAMGGDGVGNAMITVATAKIDLPWSVIFFRGILCNFLVCLAVWMGFAGRTVIDKIFTIIFPVMAFVACGFEHSIANMFFLPMAFVMKMSGFAYAGAGNIDVLTIGGIFFNISAATLGNIVGGSFLVGMMYWRAFRKKSA